MTYISYINVNIMSVTYFNPFNIKYGVGYSSVHFLDLYLIRTGIKSK